MLLFEPLFPDSVALYPEEVTETLHPLTAILFSIVNGFYEEVLVVGYVFLALASRYGFNTALTTSTAIRLLYHLYQGPVALIAIIPMGFCYPGKGRSGDLPPRKVCAPLWHGRLFQQSSNLFGHLQDCDSARVYNAKVRRYVDVRAGQ